MYNHMINNKKPAYTVGTISTTLLLTQGMPVRGNPLTPTPHKKP